MRNSLRSSLLVVFVLLVSARPVAAQSEDDIIPPPPPAASDQKAESAEPAPGETPPAPSEIPPAPGEAPPAPSEIPPAPGEVPPAASQIPPAPGETPPAPSEIPPAPGEIPPAPSEIPPAPGQIPPAPGEIPPPPGEIPPAPGEGPPAPGQAPAAPGQVPAPAVPGTQPSAPPKEGSHLSADDNKCALCHTEAGIWQEDQLQLYLPKEKLEHDVHFLLGVNCHDCHGGDYTTADFAAAHQGVRSMKSPEHIKVCGNCHDRVYLELNRSRGVGVHGAEGGRDEQGRLLPMACTKCHGTVAHELLPVTDPRSPVFVDNQVATCGGCHEQYKESYLKSVHGRGLDKSGLLVTATCASCHGAHGIYPKNDDRSTLNSDNVAQTCGSCHRFIAERLERSVHGSRGAEEGQAKTRDGKATLRATCTSCHQGHDLVDPESIRFRLRLPSRCGTCHQRLSEQYAMSIHGELTELGYGPAAKCSDCHGAHDVLPSSDPQSRLSAENRAETCRECHPRMVHNALFFDPHADHTDAKRNPVVHWVYVALLTLLFTVFGVFGIHSLLWFVRSLVAVLVGGRARGLTPRGPAYIRFHSFHRKAHALLLVSFLGLALTGLPLKYSHSGWAKELAYYLGGFDSTSAWHRIFAVVTFGCFFAYIWLMARRLLAVRKEGGTWRAVMFGPDSPLPTWRDLKDFGRMLRWFVGLGPKPAFERWSYWEKFDFWGACGDVMIIGTTGLILWFPNLFCSFLPGTTLNVAKVIHSTQALLATGFVFAIHFFNTHLRAEKFPADMSVLTGLVSQEEMKEERGDYLRRLDEEGRLDEFRATAPSRARLWGIKLLGFVALFIGLAMLAGMIVASLGH